MIIKLLFSILFLTFLTSANPLCLKSYSPSKKELEFIYQALSLHVEKKEISLELTKKSLLAFAEILDPYHFLLLENEINFFKNISDNNAKVIHTEVLNSSRRDFHSKFQEDLKYRLSHYANYLGKSKEFRKQILKKIPKMNPLKKALVSPSRPRNQEEALVAFQNYIAMKAAMIKYLAAAQDSAFTISDKEALIMAIRDFKHFIIEEAYLYHHSTLPALIAKSYINNLDAHSHFLLSNENLLFFQSFKGEYSGIGIDLLSTFRGQEIMDVFEKSGASQAGLRKGDIITHVEVPTALRINYRFPKDNPETQWVNVRNVEDQQLIANALRGPENSYVKIKIFRDGQYLEKKVQRRLTAKGDSAIRLKTYPTRKGNIAHIEFDSFYGQSAKHLEEKIREAKRANAQGLILDLRGNSGGSVEEMIQILGFFVKEGPAMVLQKAQGTEVRSIHRFNSTLWDKPLIVLTNRYSASASEGLSGALKDYGRAIIIGTDARTYGKGSMQSVIPLTPHFSMKVTTSTFSSPRGNHRQFDGVDVDIIIRMPLEKDFLYEKDLENVIEAKDTEDYLPNEVSYIPSRDEIIKQLKLGLPKKRITKKELREAEENGVDLGQEQTLEIMTQFIELLGR